MKWLVARFYQAAPPYKQEPTYRHVLLQSYDSDQAFGIPFLIAEAARAASADAALLVGPPVGSALAAKAGDFAHAVWHILEGQDISFAWIAPGGLLSKSNFMRAHLDFIWGAGK